MYKLFFEEAKLSFMYKLFSINIKYQYIPAFLQWAIMLNNFGGLLLHTDCRSWIAVSNVVS
jgi:hypothetical protein